MTYRANKIRQRTTTYLSEEWPVELDPKPYRCAMNPDARHDMPDEFNSSWWCGTFAPRPGYEQDRSKYE